MKQLTILLLSLLPMICGASAHPLDPERWRDEYIAEPARKAMIGRYTTPMEKETYTALRSLTLAKLIATRCRGSSLDPDIVRDYLAESGVGRLSTDDLELATIVVNAEFSYFDLTRLKTLCAGAGYLFGDKGVLVPDLVSPGLGLPIWSEPRGEHWITVDPFRVHVDGTTRVIKSAPATRPDPSPARRRPVAERSPI